MKKSFLLLCLLGGLLASAQKIIRDTNAQTRPVGHFHAVEVSRGVDLYLRYGDEALAVSATEPHFRDRIKTSIKNGVLKIGYMFKDLKDFKVSSSKSLKAYVSYKELEALKASDNSDIKVEGTIKSDQLSINLFGSSDFNGVVEVRKLKVNQSGISDANINGTAADVSIGAKGSSDFNGFGLIAENCSIHASGNSDVQITANRTLNGKIIGGSDIFYKGMATVQWSGSRAGIKK
ncbi:MAG: DUF2807 domain-containing protein [Bacteroidota bacterium]|nr:DUF2807 domain-containing protein [Bacteroidota bacterium]